MKSSGYDSFFKQARKNAGSAGPAKRPVKTPPKPPGKKELSDYSEKELRKIFNMKETPDKIKRKSGKRSRKSPKSSSISLGGGLVAVFFMVLSTFVFIYPDEINAWWDGVEFRIMGQASAADQEKTSTEKAGAGEESSPDQKQVGNDKKSGKESEEIKDISYFSKLNDRKKQLDLREKELEELEQELNKQKVEIEARIQYLEKVRRDIAGVLKDRVEVDQEKVKKLVEFYSSMKPAQAAEIIGTINEDLAIGVLQNMKKKNAAAILNMIEPKKARKLSEKFAGYIKD